MSNIPCAFAVDSLIHAQVCTRSNLDFSVRMLGRFQSNSGIIPCAFAVDSLIHAQVCTRPNLDFSVRMLGRFQSNSGIIH
jgi:sensor domain CHASE-containing protein